MMTQPHKTKKIGLALGSGAARGLAHIGVLKVLEEEGIGIDVIAGTSIGAFIGALYAAGVSVAQMEEVALNVDWRRLARLIDPTFPSAGLIDGKKVSLFMSELLPVRTFEELQIPLAVIATDLETGEPLIIKKGQLLKALQAAVAFPGIFPPIRFGDRFLIDGGLCNPVPGDVALDLGAEVVIGVCAIPAIRKPRTEAFLPEKKNERQPKGPFLGFFNSRNVENVVKDLWRQNNHEESEVAAMKIKLKAPGIFKVCAQSIAIMENEINALRLERNHLDILIRPDLNDITLLEFHRAAEAIQAGENATRLAIDKIKALARPIESSPFYDNV
jgi:NTE family protein